MNKRNLQPIGFAAARPDYFNKKSASPELTKGLSSNKDLTEITCRSRSQENITQNTREKEVLSAKDDDNFIRDLSVKKVNYKDLVKDKLHFMELMTNARAQELSKSIAIKETRATEKSIKHIKDRRLKAINSHRYLQRNIDRAKEMSEAKIQEIVNKRAERERVRPQKLADSLNKPGVISWLNTASGGRIKSTSPDLPQPSNSSTLKNWDAFSGYLGPQYPVRNMSVSELDSKDKRGFCYKLDPVYRNFTYDQAVFYISLREKGLNKQTAIALSHKIYCNLYEKERKAEKIYVGEDDKYDELEKRFEEYVKKHQIREGEIVKNDEEMNFSKADDNSGKDDYKEVFKKLERYREIKPQDEDSKNKADGRSPPRQTKSGVSKLLRKLISMRKKPSKSPKTEDVSPCPSVDVPEFRHSITQIPQDDRIVIENRGAIYTITSVKPKGRGQVSDPEIRDEQNDVIPQSNKSSEFSYAPSVIPINNQVSEFAISEESDHSSNIYESLPNITSHKKLDFKKRPYKQPNYTSENPKKYIQKKQELKEKILDNLKSVLNNKLKKIKDLSEKKKQNKQQIEEVSKVRKEEYSQKVKAMKDRKDLNLNEETESIQKNYTERLKRAEENKKKIEEEREKKLESQRNQYNSQRFFVEMIQSLIMKK